jgi:hypothetical protein
MGQTFGHMFSASLKRSKRLYPAAIRKSIFLRSRGETIPNTEVKDPSQRTLGISAAGSRFAHARKAPQVKPRWADGTARESVWESR